MAITVPTYRMYAYRGPGAMGVPGTIPLATAAALGAGSLPGELVRYNSGYVDSLAGINAGADDTPFLGLLETAWPAAPVNGDISQVTLALPTFIYEGTYNKNTVIQGDIGVGRETEDASGVAVLSTTVGNPAAVILGFMPQMFHYDVHSYISKAGTSKTAGQTVPELEQKGTVGDNDPRVLFMFLGAACQLCD